ncbi:MAG: ABC transporter permease, partial [Gammaproteobacteria bacterium]
MTTTALSTVASHPMRFVFERHRGLMFAVLVFAVLFGAQNLISPSGYTFFDFSYQSGGGATLALAAMGQTIVILSGGFDLSVGAVISFVNVILASGMGDSIGSQIGFGFAALAIGGLVGAFNGFFVAFLRMQAIVVTLSTMFIIQGATLLIMDKPGGYIPGGFISFLNGTAIPDVLPAPIIVLLVALLLWRLLKHSRFGVALYAVGSDRDAAASSGVRVRLTLFSAYTLAGCFYGAAGAFISSQTGSADPLVGNPMLLQVFTAVVVGGTMLGGGRGGCLGTVFGAYSLMIIVNIL